MKKNLLLLVAIAFIMSINVNAFSSNVQKMDPIERKLEGTIISTPGGGGQANVFDGDFATFYDPNVGKDAWIGLDLGSPVVVSTIKVAPRLGQEGRMNGAKLQGANKDDFSDAVDLFNIADPAGYLANELTVIPVTDAKAYRYLRYLGTGEFSFCNIAELEFWTLQPKVDPTSLSITSSVSVYKVEGIAKLTAVFEPANTSNQKVEWVSSDEKIVKVSTLGEINCIAEGTAIIYATSDADLDIINFIEIVVLPSPETATKLTGTVLGTLGSWEDNPAATRDAAFDGDVTTFFDSNVGDFSWVGLDFGSPQVITKFKICPREGWTGRMKNGEVQASNSETFDNFIVLYKLVDELPSGKLTTIEIDDNTPYRYARYVAPVDGWGNVAELSFWNDATSSVLSILAGEISVYPNPLTEGNATINLTGFESEKNIQLRMITMNGQVVLNKAITSSSITINRSGLASGLYCVSIYTDNGVKNIKLAVK